MTYSFLFWLLVILAIIFNLWSHQPGPATAPGSPGQFRYRPFVGTLFIFILIILLGLGTYGPALHR
jgi:hypothetical protein